ncbi:MAG TPA: hypothetical protein VKR57_08035 [Terriglobales bacterium]|nr:hypothetical protein [Terriglobales bacterium]
MNRRNPAFSIAALWPDTCKLLGMILLITCVAKAQECAQALQEATLEPVTVCTGLQEAARQLEVKEFSAVVFDLLLLDAQPDEGETVLKHLGSAVPVYLNFAVTGTARVVGELRWAMQRRKREMLVAKSEAEQALRHELRDTITALLLSCEMARQIPELPPQAASKMQAVEALAKEVSAKLGT